jgi:hypothetical protein
MAIQMSRFRIPFTNVRLNNCHALPASMALMLLVALIFIPDRGDVLTYDDFRLDPPNVSAEGEKATLRMSVRWHKPACELLIQTTAWPISGGRSYQIEGTYTARVRDGQQILVDKPRATQLPPMLPGEYLIGLSRAEGRCPYRFWEHWLPINNTPPKPTRFTVR